MNHQYEKELSRKQELDNRLAEVRTELNNIEQTFPQELMQLKQRIAEAKKETAEYEKKTQELAQQLRDLKAKAQGDENAAAQGSGI